MTALPLLLGVTLLVPYAISPSGSFDDAFAVLKFLIAVLLIFSPIIPATIIKPSRVILPMKFRTIPWQQVAAVQVVDLPGSKEGIRLKLNDERIVTLTGVPADRLPAILYLAEASQQPE